MSTQFVVNTIIEWVCEDQDETPLIERILWIDGTGRQMVVIVISEENHLPVFKSSEDLSQAISEKKAFKRAVDPFVLLANHDPQFIEKHQKRMDRAWDVIKEIVQKEPEIYSDKYRGKLIRDVSKAFGVAPKEVYKFLKRYWVGGKTRYALLPFYRNCGAPGKERQILKSDTDGPKRGRPSRLQQRNPDNAGVNVDEDMKNIFRIAMKLYYNKSDAKPLKGAFGLMIDNHFNVGYRTVNGTSAPIIPPAHHLPTFEQFRYWGLKEISLTDSVIAREGHKRYQLNSRPILGNSTQMAFGPGSIFQIDATIGDVYLVSKLNRSWIVGRPVVYFVVDVFSRMIAGLYVGLEGPSWLSGMMAIANATTDKVAYCAEYGISITDENWPCTFLPVSVLADRGEFIGLDSDRLPGSLDIPLSNCPPYRADWKGIVEQMFRRANLKTIHWLPGAVRKRERGDSDHRLDATLDLHQFTKIIIYNVLEYNFHHRIEDYPMDMDMISAGVEPIPIDLWNWGISNRAGLLRESTADLIRLNLMPSKMATVTAQGIRFEGMYYSTEKALREEWYVRARRDGTWKVSVSYDPRRLDAIYLQTKDKGTVDVCTLLPGSEVFKDQTLEEVQDYFALQKTHSKLHESRRMQSGAELRAQIAAIETEAAEMKKETPISQSNNQRVKGIRDNRAVEKQINRETESFDLRQPKKGSEPGKLVSLRPTVSEEESTPLVTSAARKKELLAVLKESLQENELPEGEGL